MTLSAHDSALWEGLIDKVLNLKIRDVAVIHKAAKRCKKAQFPKSEWKWNGDKIDYKSDSPFLKLLAVSGILEGGDALQRQTLCDYAHQCRAMLDGKPDPTKTARDDPPSLPFRRDIDG